MNEQGEQGEVTVQLDVVGEDRAKTRLLKQSPGLTTELALTAGWKEAQTEQCSAGRDNRDLQPHVRKEAQWTPSTTTVGGHLVRFHGLAGFY